MRPYLQQQHNIKTETDLFLLLSYVGSFTTSPFAKISLITLYSAEAASGSDNPLPK
jgi:hypothetical protein